MGLQTPHLRLYYYMPGYGWGERDPLTGRYTPRILGFYNGDDNEIGWGFDIGQKEPREEDLEILVHEYLHWVLHRRVGREACDRLDKIRLHLEVVMQGNARDRLITLYCRTRRHVSSVQQPLTKWLKRETGKGLPAGFITKEEAEKRSPHPVPFAENLEVDFNCAGFHADLGFGISIGLLGLRDDVEYISMALMHEYTHWIVHEVEGEEASTCLDNLKVRVFLEEYIPGYNGHYLARRIKSRHEKARESCYRMLCNLALQCKVPVPKVEFWDYLPNDSNVTNTRDYLDGEFLRWAKVIRLALDSRDIQSTAVHEFIHYYIDLKARDALDTFLTKESDVKSLTKAILEQPENAKAILDSFLKQLELRKEELRRRMEG